MKKLAALFLVLIMMTGTALADTSVLNTESVYPVVKSELTLNMLGPRDASQGEWQDLKFFKKWQEITGVTLNIETVPEDNWATSINLRMMEEGNLPDFIYAGAITAAQEVDWGDDQGILLPLEDLIPQYMPNLSALLDADPVLRSSITTPAGHIYCLPWINDMPRDLTSGKYWINNAWLKKLGLSEPKTVDELYAALKAFKEQDPNGNGKADEIPYSGTKQIKDFYRTLAWWGKNIDNTNFLGTTDDGEVYYGPLTAEWKDMVTFWANAWKDGLVDPQIFEMDSAALKAKGQAEGDQTLGMFQTAGAFLVVPSEQNEEYSIVGCLVKNEGDTPVWTRTTGLTRGALAITCECEYPEVVLRMADWVYEWKEYEGGIYNMRGEAGVDFYYVDENGEQTEQAKIDREHLVLEYTGYDSFEVKRAKVLTANSGSITPGIGGGTMPQVIYPLNDWINAEVERQQIPYWKVAYPDVYLSAKDTNRAADLKVQLDYAVETWTAEFITGSKSVETDYDAFLNEIQKLGEEYLAIYQAAYAK